MPDSAVSVYIDPSGQPWFACVLGANREVFGRLAWPDVRSHRPGFFPWHPDEAEIRHLIAAIPGVLRFAELYRHHPHCYDEHGELELPTVPDPDTPLTLETLEWRTWVTPPPAGMRPPVTVDRSDPAYQRAAALPSSNETIEVDWFHMPEPVSDGGRPFYPRCVAAFRSNGGYCFGMELLKPDDDWAPNATRLILKAAEGLGARPARIIATKEELAVRLQPWAASLGAETKQVRRLTAAEEFRAGIDGHFRAGGRIPQ